MASKDSPGGYHDVPQATDWDANRKLYEPSMKTLGSFPRKIGPAADVRELEYISSLLQNADDAGRIDGTISSKDIAPYLSSRYGMEITPEQAVDIAKNLCGGKKRSDLAAQKQIHDKEMIDKTQKTHENDSVSKDGEEAEEEVFYFDLVQVMSLLLIPELVQLADKENTNKNVQEVLTAVINSLTEIFDEGVQRDLRNGGPVDEDTMKRILLAFGDVDAANSPELLQQMLDALGGTHASFTVENLLRALTSDVGQSFSEKMKTPASSGRTSTFFDIFGWNWEDPVSEDKIKGGAPSPTKTASYIDYAIDSYGSVALNTAMWCLFILTTLVYLNFTKKAVEENSRSMICPPEKSFGCAVGNMVISWLIMALFFGLYGVFFLVPTSIGNVAGKSSIIYFSLFATFAFTYAPFSALVSYRRGMNHHEIEVIEYKTVCPALFDDKTLSLVKDPYGFFLSNPDGLSETELQAQLDDMEEYYAELAVQMTVDLPYDCLPKVEWCKASKEVQGRYIDPDEEELTYDEFEKCNFIYDTFLGFVGTFQETGGPCDYDVHLDSQCRGAGGCSLRDFSVNATETLDYICCHGDAHDTVSSITNSTIWVCDNQPLSSPCFADDLCDSGKCDLENGICVKDTSGKADENLKLIGEPCGTDHSICKSGFCLDETCGEHPLICPVNSELYNATGFNFEKFGGYRLDPYCRTMNRWCEMTNLTMLEKSLNWFNESLSDLQGSLDLIRVNKTIDELLQETGLNHTMNIEVEPALDMVLSFFNESLESSNLTDANLTNATVTFDVNDIVLDQCTAAFLLLREYGIVNYVDESEAEVGDVYTIPNHDHLEESLLDDWTYYSLISIGVLGVFAVLAILKKIVSRKGDDRPRDFVIKQAGENKILNAMQNALNMHAGCVQTKGQVMRNYFLRGEEIVEVGGLFWTLKHFVSGALAAEEGIRYPGRIWVGLVTQLVVTIIGLSYALETIAYYSNWLQEWRDSLAYKVTQAIADTMSNEEFSQLTEDELTVTYNEQHMLDLLPAPWMLKASGYTGVCAGLAVAIFCMLVYIPSVTNTLLKLRNGMIPSLHDPFYDTFKKTPDNVVQNIGNMVFSLMGASAMMAGVISGIVFSFSYPYTREQILKYVATAIGIATTMVIKIVGQKLLRGRHFSSFYRKMPASANFANLFFECWYIGTGLLVVVVRLVTFIVAGVLWLGRIDVEFLHPDVKVFGTGLDGVPVSFKRDLLVHEAHNHPYIERLGGMYLRRLKDGQNFGTVAGTTWRCLFASGLMPWIVKYKVSVGDGYRYGDGNLLTQKGTKSLSEDEESMIFMEC